LNIYKVNTNAPGVADEMFITMAKAVTEQLTKKIFENGLATQKSGKISVHLLKIMGE